MKPVRLLVSNNADDTDKKSVGASPKLFSNMSSGGRYRRLSLDGESLGCLSLLDAGEQVERPHAFPSLGLAGEILPSCGLKVHAQPIVPIHRPRAVLSSPGKQDCSCVGDRFGKGHLWGRGSFTAERYRGSAACSSQFAENDELQGQQVEKSTSSNGALKSLEACSKDLPIASLSSDLMSPSKEVPKAVVSPPDELFYMGEIETSISDETSSCSTSSNLENNNVLLLSHKPSNELVDIKLSRILTAEALKEKKANAGLPPKSRHEQNGNEENLTIGTAANRLVKKHSGLPTNSPRRSPKQSSSPRSVKGNSGRVLRPWY